MRRTYGSPISNDDLISRCWVPGWAHPFESRHSLLRKFDWITDGDFSSRNLALGVDQFKDDVAESWILADKLASNVPKFKQQSFGWLHALLNLPFAVCAECLQAGYWSEIPQLAGLRTCPLHGRPLQFRCKCCGGLLRFGQARFKGSAFECQQCGVAIAPRPSDAWRQWRSPPSEELERRFGILVELVKKLAENCSGYWKLPWRDPEINEQHWDVSSGDFQAIVQSFAHQFPFPSLRQRGFHPSYSRCEEVVAHRFFVADENGKAYHDLGEEFAFKRYQDSLFRDFKEWYQNRSGELALIPRACEISINRLGPHGLTMPRECKMPERVRWALGLLDSQITQNGTCPGVRFRFWVYNSVGKLYERRDIGLTDYQEKRVALILASGAVWQVARVQMWINWLANQVLVKVLESSRMSDEIATFVKNQPYEVQLHRGRIDDHALEFTLHEKSWVPPYRIQREQGGITLTIFHFVPS